MARPIENPQKNLQFPTLWKMFRRRRGSTGQRRKAEKPAFPGHSRWHSAAMYGDIEYWSRTAAYVRPAPSWRLHPTDSCCRYFQDFHRLRRRVGICRERRYLPQPLIETIESDLVTTLRVCNCDDCLRHGNAARIPHRTRECGGPRTRLRIHFSRYEEEGDGNDKTK